TLGRETAPDAQPMGELGPGEAPGMIEDVRHDRPQTRIETPVERHHGGERLLHPVGVASAQKAWPAQPHLYFVPAGSPADPRVPSAWTFTSTCLATRRTRMLGSWRP